MDYYLYPVAGAVALLTTLLLYNASHGLLAHIPGPWYTKFTSLPYNIACLTGTKAQYVHKLHQQYGPVVRVTPDEADLCDVSAKQTIYSTKEVFRKSIYYDHVSGGDTSGIFATRDIDKHRYLRRLLSGPMSDNSLKTVEPLVRRYVDLTILRMKETMQHRDFVDVFHWFFLMTSNIIGELSFGESFGDLETGKKGSYLQDFHNIDWAGTIFVVFPWIFKHPLLFGIASVIPAIRGALTCFDRVTRYAQESLGRYRRLVDEDPVNVKPTLFTKVLKAGEEETLTFDEVVQNARVYLVAGSDTTSNALTYLIWAVCKQPEIRDKLVAELREKLPETNSSFTDADLRSLPYLNGVIEEALRLYSPGPAGLPRSVPSQGAELGGYWFPAGVTVTTQAYSLHRDPTIYPDPETFDPERWSEGRVTKRMKDANMAWGGGARACIGIHLAKMELRLATALFFRTFPKARVSTVGGMSDKDMEQKAHLLLAPRGGRCYIEEEPTAS